VIPTPQRLGKYEILEELGRGAFAAVYRALDSTLDREVALKILHPPLLTDPTFVERFQREARAMASLDHQHIAPVYEIGEAEERVYIALYLAHGPNLGEVLTEQGRFAWPETLSLLQPLCEALDYAHGRGVVHRDLKPANILLDSERGPLLTDFGFARLMGDSSVSLSLSGGILGTPAYIAPEVWELDAAEQPADIYALGCILYEMLTGEVLFAGKTPMQAMRAHDQGPAYPETWPEDVPADIETVLNKTLARDPAARYPSASAFWHALYGLEAQSQAAREAAEQAAVVAQWREETQVAMAAGEWNAAKMAVARWLALAPNDLEGKVAQTKIHQQVEQSIREKPSSIRMSSQEAKSEHLASEATLIKRQTKSRAIPNWLWIGGGVIGILGVAFFLITLLSGTFITQVLSFNIIASPQPSRTSRPTAILVTTNHSTSTPLPTSTSTAVSSTSTTTPTPAPPTSTPLPTSTSTATPTPVPSTPVPRRDVWLGNFQVLSDVPNRLTFTIDYDASDFPNDAEFFGVASFMLENGEYSSWSDQTFRGENCVPKPNGGCSTHWSSGNRGTLKMIVGYYGSNPTTTGGVKITWLCYNKSCGDYLDSRDDLNSRSGLRNHITDWYVDYSKSWTYQ
jgi:serine/threonine-protein kinase